jgi:autotransporter-associated beta strand protein
VVIDNDIIVNTNALTNFRGAVFSYSGNLTTPSLAIVNGDIEIQSGVGNGGHLGAEASSQSVLRVMGAINTSNGIIPLVRVGTVELGGGGNYTALNQGEGILKLAASNGINPTASLNLALSNPGSFDLNGFNQSLAGLTRFGAPAATVTNNGASTSTLTLDLAAAGTFTGTFADGTGSLNLSKIGAGTLTLSGVSSSFTGGLTVTNGGLNLTGTVGAAGATATMGFGTTLSGEGTFGGNLAINGTVLNVNGSSSPGIFASGNINSTGGVSVNLLSLPTTPGPITIIEFGTALTGNAANFSLLGVSNYRSPVFSVAANAVNLTLGTPVDLTWTGTGGSDWDTATTSNWNNPSLVPSPFYFADNVTFGNTGGGTVGVPADVNAANLVINSTSNWLFQGAGTVAAASVTKDGSGSATFETPVNFSGPVTLTAGILKLSPPTGVTTSLPGAITGAGTLAKGGDGILSLLTANAGFTGSVVISKGELVVGNATALGAGTLTFGDATTAPTDVAKLTLNSGTTVTGKTITVAPECLSAAVSSLGGTLATATILKRGPGTLRIGDASNQLAVANYLTGTSTITVEGGVIGFSSITATTASTTIVLGTANSDSIDTILDIPVAASADQAVLPTPVTLGTLGGGSTSKAILRYSGSSASVGSSNFSGTVALNGRDLYIENKSDVTPGSIIRLWAAAGAISGTGNVHIRDGVTATGDYSAGPRTRLTGTNTWVGDLFVETGMVQIGNGSAGSALNAIPNTAVVYMSAGTRMGIGGGSETFAGIVGGAAAGTAAAAILNRNTGGAGTTTVTLSGTETYVYDGTMSDEGSTHAFALVKSTGGTQTVNGACSFTGATSITGGKLILNSTHTSAITVSAGATLGGNMTSTAAVTATAAGAKITPGNSTGTLTAASANLSTGGVLEMELNDASVPTNDKLVTTGALTITSATLNLVVTGTPTAPVYVLASYGTLTGTFGTVTGKPTNYDLVYNYNDGASSNNIALVKQTDAYLDWLAAYPALTGTNRAPGEDFDNDGLDNGVEFVIGSDPTAPTATGRPAATVIGGNLEFTFKRSDASEAYAVSVELGTDLATWPTVYNIPGIATSGPVVYVTDNGPTTPDDVIVRVPMAPDTKKFAWLKAVIPFTP